MLRLFLFSPLLVLCLLVFCLLEVSLNQFADLRPRQIIIRYFLPLSIFYIFSSCPFICSCFITLVLT